MGELLFIIRLLFRTVRDAFADWRADQAPRFAAAVAFYTVFSLAPLAIMALAITGLMFGETAAQGQIISHVESLTGHDVASVIQSILASTHAARSGALAAVMSIGILLLGATAVFAELQHALNRIWEVRATGSIKGIIRRRLVSFLTVLGCGFVLAVGLLVNAALVVVENFLGDMVLVLRLFFFLLNVVLPFSVVTALFAMFYKVLPDVDIEWGAAWVGALITALLFALGNYVLSFYLSRGMLRSAYGAAGSFVVFLIWVYYSAQIFFFGAEVTHAYSKEAGIQFTLARGATPLSGQKKERG